MLPEPRAYTADELRVGLAAEFQRDITEADVEAFARLSGDRNPLHTDAAYARQSTYAGRLVHGAFQVGLASAMLGMYLPGRHALLGSVHARFPAPLYVPAAVTVRGEIAAWNRAQRAGQLRVVVQEASARVPVAEVALGFSLHEKRGADAAAEAPQPEAKKASGSGAGRNAVLLTGAAGGIGSTLCADLAADHRVLALVHRQPLADELASHSHVDVVRGDLAAPGWEDAVAAALGDAPLYAVVHAAWPGAPRGGLLDAPEDVVGAQLAFGATSVIRLARLLFARVGPGGGRLVALGSVAGGWRPVLALGAYSLGKAALEQTVRLLAPELARKGVTANAVCPSFVPVGMHQQAGELARKRETALVPLGRLCEPGDVAGTVRYLLSDAAAFVSGQLIGLTGGQL